MILTLAIILLCGLWLLIYSYLIFSIKRIPRFHRVAASHPDRWPRLSVIVPACNEAQHLEAAVKTLLAQDYPDLEIVLVNDRSTDGTGEILNALAAADARIKPVHIDVLPAGWLGKVHALHRGLQVTTGEWLLITDADVHFRQGALSKAVAYSLMQTIDHLALLPEVKTRGFWLNVAISSFGLLFLLNTRAAQVNQRNSKAFVGVGAFNLVKRATFNKTPGFEWLRLEVVDDAGVGYMIKKAGGQTHFAIADQDLSLSWYDSIGAMFRGLEKNLFGASSGYRWWKTAAQVGFMWLLLAAPLLAIVSSNPLLLSAGLAWLAMHVLFGIVGVRNRQRETLLLLMFPAGVFIMTLMMLWSAYRCLRQGGVTWRGTYYSINELRKGQRFTF